MPDQESQPLEFLHWRVDTMFDTVDIDRDGKISEEEFTGDFGGEIYNFQRMDADADGYLVKQEIVDDMVPVLREEGKIQ